MYVGFFDNGQKLIGPNTAVTLATHQLSTMMVEHDIPLTEVTADGDSIGLVYDQTINALILKQPISASRPILGSDGTRNSYITFDGTNDYLTILSSLSFFNTFWDVVPKGTILIWFKMNGGDGASQMLMSNTDYAVAVNDAGMQIMRNGPNITVRATDNFSVSGFRWTYTSTQTVAVADGWRGLIVSINGTGASAGRFILMNSGGTILEDQTFAVAAGTVVNAQTNMQIGARADATTPDLFANCSISAIIVENFPVTDSLIDQFKNHNPAKTSVEFSPILQSQIDMNVGAYVFNNAAGTVVAAANDPVRVIRNNVIGNFNTIGSFGALRRTISSTTSGTSPLYRTNVLNGRAALEFDGIDDNMDFLNTLFEELGGKWTFFMVVENQDVSLGSHIMSGNNYFVLTGSAYVGGLTSPYAIAHPDPAGTQVGIEGKNTGSDGAKVFAFRRDGTALAAWNGNKTKATDTSSSRFSIDDMGLAHSGPGATWNFDGYMFIFKKYNGVMTDAQVEAEIDRLNSEYGL